MNDERGAVIRMRIGRRNGRSQRKPAPIPLFPPQVLYDLTWGRTRVASMGSRRLTALAMAQPNVLVFQRFRLLKREHFLMTRLVCNGMTMLLKFALEWLQILLWRPQVPFFASEARISGIL
jgi:hypothetical protein